MNSEIFKQIRKTKKIHGKVSIPWIQCHFKMSHQDAMTTLEEFEEKAFVPFRKNGRFAKKES